MPGAYDAVVHHALGVVTTPLARAAYGINPIGGFTQVYSEAASGSGGVRNMPESAYGPTVGNPSSR